MDIDSKLSNFAKSNRYVQDSLNLIQSSFLRYKLDETCVSFNGGKDCTATLHLVRHVSNNLFSSDDSELRVFYAQLPHRFQEEENFVIKTVETYNLKLMQYSTNSLRDSLQKLQEDVPSMRAIFVGTRADDLKPGVTMTSFAPTDQDWPDFMRINPILDWSYAQVWQFIRELDIPYCDLYNQGYSSIGTMMDTLRNPNLESVDAAGRVHYKPAWTLDQTVNERISRIQSAGTDKTIDKETTKS